MSSGRRRSERLKKRKRLYFFPEESTGEEDLEDLLETSDFTDVDNEQEIEISSECQALEPSEEDFEREEESEDLVELDDPPEDLIEQIHNKLKEKCPALSIKRSALRKFIGNTLNTVASGELEDSEEQEEKLSESQRKELDMFKKEIKENSPTLALILSSSITYAEKKQAIQMYKVFQQTMPGTDDFFNLYNEFQSLLSTDEKLTEGEKEELAQLRKAMEEDIPTIRQILSTRLPLSKKKEALKIYDAMIRQQAYSLNRLNTEKNLQMFLENEKYFLETETNLEEFERKEKKYQDKAIMREVELQAKIFDLDASEEVKLRIYEIFLKMKTYASSSSEYASLRDKISWAIQLPHRRIKISNLGDLTASQYCDLIRRRLDERLYGLVEVKESVIEMVNNRLYNPHAKTMLGLKGLPGLGKTEVAQSLAYALDLPFERISLGGMVDASIFRGSDNVWVGSTPSIILQILKRMTFANGVILFDELDKLDPLIQYALLHITDYTQNKDFQDFYLNEFPHDLSNIWFMFAMNDDGMLDDALRDRIKIIEVKPYTCREKTVIIQKYLLPKHLKSLGMSKGACTITRSACGVLVDKVNSTSIRPLSKNLFGALSKINLLRTRLESPSKMPLTYELEDFFGFPYEINAQSITILCKENLHIPSYYV